jgi:PAS domain S-box-containing protein
VQLSGAEHFDANTHQRVCTAVPIFSPENTMLGIINMVENCVENCCKTAKYSMSVMVALSKGVEYNLLQRRKQKQLEMSNHFSRAILEEISDAIIVVNLDGRISLANKTAVAIVQAQNGELVGRAIEEFFGADNYFSQVMLSGQSIFNKEILIKTGERGAGTVKRHIGTIRPVRSDSIVYGVIGTFRDMNSTRKLLKHFGGWMASFTFDSIIGNSPALLQTIELARQTANLQSNTLIQGESGTGKEMFAQAIHNASRFRKGPFVAINCAAIPSSLLESELFGYESGAYTGAKKNGQSGKFELAEGGTIFLDEINSIPLDMQAKLLRVLQEKVITRVGGTASISLDLKVVAACNVNLWDMVAQGLFRSDLFYRLNVITIQVPPLRERISDIPMLAENILARKSFGQSPTFSVSKDALLLLQGYSWPGNVRELENLLERAYVYATISQSNEINVNMLSKFPKLFSENGGDADPRGDAPAPPLPPVLPLKPLKHSESDIIREAFAQCRWNISKTARTLGVARNTLYRKMKEYDIVIPD